MKQAYNGKAKVKTKAEEVQLNFNKFNVIPTNKIPLFKKLKAKGDEEKVHFIYSRSAYGTDKPNISIKCMNDFIYPVVYTITKKKKE